MASRSSWRFRSRAAQLAECVRPPLDAPAATPPPPFGHVLPSAARTAVRAAFTAAAVAAAGCSRPPLEAPPAAYTDTFTDSAGTSLTGHTPDAGGSWTIHSAYAGDGKITAAGRARIPAQLTESVVYWSGTPGSADYDCSADFYVASNLGTAGILSRVDTLSNTFVYAQYYGGVLTLGNVVGGTRTPLGTSTPSWSVGSTHRVVLRVQGSTASAFVDGSLVIGPVAVSPVSAGKAGVYFSTASGVVNDSTTIQLDNLLAFGAIPPQDPVQLDSTSQVVPVRAKRPPAAWSSLDLVRSPMDQGVVPDPSFKPVLPSRVERRRSRAPQLTGSSRTPPDMGAAAVQPTSSVAPARIERRRSLAPQLAGPTQSPLDQGVATTPPPIAPCLPPVHRPRSAVAPQAGLVVRSPVDQGVDSQPPPIAPCLPPVHRPRSAVAPQAGLVVRSPVDQGVDSQPPPIAPCLPHRVERRRNPAPQLALSILRSPIDQGLIVEPPPVGPCLPAAPVRLRRASPSAYEVLVGLTPRDQGISPTPPPIAPQLPGRPRGAARAAASAYEALVGITPRDAGIEGTAYNVYSNTGAGDPIDYNTVIFTTAGVTWTSDALSYPGVWSFGVRAFNPFGEEKNLDCALTIELDSGAIDVSRIPTPPYSLRATAREGGVIRLEWHYVAPNRLRKPTAFHVYYGTAGVDYGTVRATISSTGQAVYRADLTGLADGTTYSFGVRALNATGEEKNTLSIDCTADSTGPSAVDGFTLTAGSSGET